MKNTRHTKPRLTDAQLKKLLASSRQDVAAPQGFSAAVTSRLRAEGLIQSPPVASPTSRARWWAPRLAWGLTAGLALAFGLQNYSSVTKTTDVASSVATAPAIARPNVARAYPAPVQALGARQSKPAPQALAQIKKNAAPVVAAASAQATPLRAPAPSAEEAKVAPLPLRGADVRSAPEAPVFGSAGGGSIGSSAPAMRAAGVNASGAQHTATPADSVSPVISAGSVVKGNVVRLSRGDQALVEVRLTKPGHVRVDVYTRVGARVDTLIDRDLPAGAHTTPFNGLKADGSSLASGIYLIVVQTAEYTQRHKVALVR